MAWKMVEGFGDRYRVSETGIVQHLSKRGKWQEVKPFLNYQAKVHMFREDGTRTVRPVARMVAESWMGGIPEGYCVVHRNGLKFDNDVTNLKLVPRGEACRMSCGSKRRSVEKVDKDGNVVALYRSVTEAARKNYMTQSAVSGRCLGYVKNPWKYDDYTYRFERCWVPKNNKGSKRYDG